jgi:hypothetical protein
MSGIGIGPGEIERILRGDEARRHAEAQRRADERRREEMERTRVGGSDRYDPRVENTRATDLTGHKTQKRKSRGC